MAVFRLKLLHAPRCGNGASALCLRFGIQALFVQLEACNLCQPWQTVLAALFQQTETNAGPTDSASLGSKKGMSAFCFVRALQELCGYSS